MNSKKYQPPPATAETRFQKPVTLGYFQIDDKDQYRLNDKVNKDDKSRYHIQTSLNYDQQPMGIYDVLSYITLCTLPCAISYDNRLTYELMDRQQGDTRLSNTTYANTTTVVTAIPVLGFLTAGRKDAKVGATFDDTLNFELAKMESLYVAYEQKIAAEEKAESGKWQRFDKRSLESVLTFRNNVKSKALMQEISDYYDSELDRAVRNFAILQGVPKKFLDLAICNFSGCGEWKLYHIFKMVALAHSLVISEGMDINAKSQGNSVTVSLKANRSVIKIYLDAGSEGMMIRKITEIKGPFEKTMDRGAENATTITLIPTLSGQPDPDKLDYAFIDKMRK